MEMLGWLSSWNLGSSVLRSCASYFKSRAARQVKSKPKNDPASFDNKGAGNSETDTKGHDRNSADAYQGAAAVKIMLNLVTQAYRKVTFIPKIIIPPIQR